MPSTGLRTVAYFVNWDLPAAQLTHVLYAFANVRETGEVYLTDAWADADKHYPTDDWNSPTPALYGCLKQLGLLKKRHRQLKVLLSVGGWTYSAGFAQIARDSSKRAVFAQSAVDLVKDCGFDGLDVDWEYPQDDQQAADYVALLRDSRQALDAYAASQHQSPRQFLLTVACPAGPANYNKLLIAEMDAHLDFWNLMGYDFAGSWDATAGHQANLFPSQSSQATPFSVSQAVDFYKSKGVAADKIVLGCPLYGRAFCNTAGPGSPFGGVGQGSWEAGVYDYKALPRPGASVHHDAQLGASWSYDAAQREMVSFDTAGVARQKAAWVRDSGLGGAMWWESSGDAAGGGVIGQVCDVFGPDRLDKTPNTLEYKASKYVNVRGGFAGE